VGIQIRQANLKYSVNDLSIVRGRPELSSVSSSGALNFVNPSSIFDRRQTYDQLTQTQLYLEHMKCACRQRRRFML
jgi:hypothetical protein